jgi:hypothetical protein
MIADRLEVRDATLTGLATELRRTIDPREQLDSGWPWKIAFAEAIERAKRELSASVFLTSAPPG